MIYMAAERKVERIFIQAQNLCLYHDDYFKVPKKNYLAKQTILCYT